jgi:hypothetical protein
VPKAIPEQWFAPRTPKAQPQRDPTDHLHRRAAADLAEQANLPAPRWVEARPLAVDYQCPLCGSRHRLAPAQVNTTTEAPCGRGRVRIRYRLDDRESKRTSGVELTIDTAAVDHAVRDGIPPKVLSAAVEYRCPRCDVVGVGVSFDHRLNRWVPTAKHEPRCTNPIVGRNRHLFYGIPRETS